MLQAVVYCVVNSPVVAGLHPRCCGASPVVAGLHPLLRGFTRCPLLCGMGSTEDFCPWCGRLDGLHAPDGVDYPICTSATFRGADVSCLWGAFLERGIRTNVAYHRQALIRLGVPKGITDALNAASHREFGGDVTDEVVELIISYVVGPIDGPDTYWDVPGVARDNTPVVAGNIDELRLIGYEFFAVELLDS